MTGWLRSVVAGRLLGGVVAVSVGLALVVVAVRADGSEASSIRLDDGAVWVLNEQAGRIGRLNVRIDELDFEARAGAGPLLQEDREVVYATSEATARKINVVNGGVTLDNELPASAVRLGGGVGVAYDPETGFIWTGSSATLVGVEFPDNPDGRIMEGGLVHVTRGPEPDGSGRGRVIVVDEFGWYELALDENFEPVRPVAQADAGTGDPTTSSVPVESEADGEESEAPPPIVAPVYRALGAPASDVVSVSSVGHVPVMLLSDGGVLIGDAEPVRIPGDGVVLQQAGPAADSVLVASDAGLYEVDLDELDVSTVSSGEFGEAAAPVRVSGCEYGAWSGPTPSLSKRCGDAFPLDGVALRGAVPGSRLVFRVNGPNVALNQPADGSVWVDRDGELAQVGSWEAANPETEETEDEPSDGQGPVTQERVCEETDASPTAGDDELGARPRQTILDVLANDDDPNCEPIAVLEVSPESGPWGELTIVNDGQHVLLSPSDEWSELAQDSAQPFSFSYTVTDGARNESNSASVSVSMSARSVVDRDPALRVRSDGSSREMRAVVEEGRSIDHDVLADWIDLDGDQLRVVDAVAEGEGRASVAGDASVRFAANGVPPGTEIVQVTVSDGVKSRTEPLEITVQPSDASLPPVATDDFLTVAAGSTGTVFPLENDSDPNEDELSLVPLWDDPSQASEGYRARVVQDDGVEIEGLDPGRYALPYAASDGDEETPGTILLRVLESTGDSAPVAVPDRVYVRSGRIANVDVLANDVDADGDLLAVSEVSVAASGEDEEVLRASVVDRRLVQIEVLPTGDGGVPPPMIVTYTVSDGGEVARASQLDADEATAASLRSRGALTVIVESADDRPPIPEPDRATVRIGDVVAVPVLRNDVDPDGDELSLASIDRDTAAAIEAAGGGVVWAEGRNVMFKAGANADDRYTIAYTVESGGLSESSVVSFEVTDAFSEEAGNNQPPEPPDLELRAVRGGSVRLQVPTSNVDRDGDSVVLVDRFDPHEGAASGNRVSIDTDSSDTIVFEASQTSPSKDRFTYRVRDVFGRTGTATVEVVVIDDVGAPPAAHDDIERGRPGRTISVATLANDTSPQDRRLSFAELPFFDREGVPSATPVNADAVSVVDQTGPEDRGFLAVEVPSVEDGPISEVYRISDDFGTAAATVRVTPDPDAPNRPPVARLDEIEVGDVVETDAGPEAAVDVVANDRDPDDLDWSPRLSLPDGQRARIDPSSKDVVVEIEELPRTVVYRVTDADGEAAVGQIRVPGTENHPPVLSEVGEAWENRRVKAGSGESIEFVLAEIVTDPDGDEPIVLTDQAVRIVQAVGQVDRLDESGPALRFAYTPPDTHEGGVIDIDFEVTDRPEFSPEDRLEPGCNCLATLRVRLVVEASEGLEGSPPRVLTTGAIQVPQLDEPASIDLADLVVDDDGDELTFEVDPPERLDVALGGAGGSVLEVVSRLGGSQGLAVGARIPIRFTVADADHEPVQGEVIATIIESNRPRPAAGEFPVFEAERGEPLELPNLVGAALNPFPDRPLRLTSSSTSGDAVIDCDELGDCVFSTATVGTFTVSYELTDDAGRAAVGALTVVAKGRPTAPGRPRVESVGDGRVNLTWAAADPQGSPITGYTVTFEGEDGTSGQENFETTGGQIDGLTNTVAYQFSVFATNELGDGETSNPSSDGIPDRLPSPPIDLRFEDYGDGQLLMAWSPPTDAAEYSEIIDYEVTIGGTVVNTGGATQYLATGLSNGTDYEFRVRARNSAEANDGWGDLVTSLVTERPSRYPDPPTGVSASNTGDGGSPRLTVTWSPPAFDGGRPVENYQVCRFGAGGSECRPSGAGETSVEFSAIRNEAFTFEVVAINGDKNRPESDPSERSEPVVAIDNPDPPVIESVVSPNGTSREIRVTLASAPNNSGCSEQYIEYRVDGGAWQQGSLTGHTFTGLTNGTTYAVTARAVLPTTCGTPLSGGQYASGASAAVPGIPYGPLQQPTMTATVNEFESVVNFSWNANRLDPSDPNYDGRDATWNASLSGPCAGQNPLAGTYQVDIGYFNEAECAITVSADGVDPEAASARGVTTNPETWDVRLRFNDATYPLKCHINVVSATVVDSSVLFGVWLLPTTTTFGEIPAISAWVDYEVVSTGGIFELRGTTTEIVRVEFNSSARQVSPGSLNYSADRSLFSNVFAGASICSHTLTYSVEGTAS